MVNSETDGPAHPFYELKPSFILNTVDDLGFDSDGRILALNSYENRVYQVGIENNDPIIAKFYRPNRWSDDQILEEHRYCYELIEQELPIVAPIAISGETLFHCGEFRLALYPRKGGHAPEFDNLDNLSMMGRFLGRIHAIGGAKEFKFRPAITSEHYGRDSVLFISKKYIPEHIRESYEVITADLLEMIDNHLDQHAEEHIRVHGDCHVGNILWRDNAPHFIDFDDSRMAPAVQDIWMLLSGDRERQTTQLCKILEAYNAFSEFPLQQLKYIEALRTLRIMYFSAWLGRRWDDPAFPRAFPWFNTTQYWEQHILDLREQLGELNEPSLNIFGH